MPATQSEYDQIYTRALGDVLALVSGVMRRFIPEDEHLEMYFGLAGDNNPESRHRLGLFSAGLEHRIDRKISMRRASIEKCYRFGLKATTTEERDVWNDKIRIHVSMIDQLNDLRIQIRRILAVGIPWLELVQSSLMHTRTSAQANAAFVPPSLERELTRALAQLGATAPTVPPPPLPDGESRIAPREEGEEEDETDSSPRTDAQ